MYGMQAFTYACLHALAHRRPQNILYLLQQVLEQCDILFKQNPCCSKIALFKYTIQFSKVLKYRTYYRTSLQYLKIGIVQRLAVSKLHINLGTYKYNFFRITLFWPRRFTRIIALISRSFDFKILPKTEFPNGKSFGFSFNQA